MKVNDRGANSVSQTSNQGRTSEVGKKSKTGKSGDLISPAEIKDSAKVNMSTEAMAIKKAKAIASKDSIDEAKVARLQKMIDEGKYKIDAEAVADRLVDEHIAMGE